MAQERLVRPRKMAPPPGGVPIHRVPLVLGGQKLKGVRITGGTVRILESAVRDKMAEVY